MSDQAAIAPFACPRCARQVTERFYGPCADCRQELAAAFAGERRGVETGAGEPGGEQFEPAMHVTPNQVATKE